MPIRQEISRIIREAIEKQPGVPASELDELASVDYGRDPAHGDLTTPVALRLAKLTGEKPAKFAEQIAQALREGSSRLSGAVDRVEIAGPGFINIYLARTYWLGLIRRILAEGPRYGRSGIGNRRRVQIEFASANPTGPLSVAHGRQAALGGVLANILRFIGFDVSTEYWVNDCGNQINRLGESVYIRYLQALGGAAPDFPAEGYHGEYITDMGRDVAAREGKAYADVPREQAIKALGRIAVDAILKQILEDFKRFGLEYDSIFSQREFEAAGHVERLLERMDRAGLTCKNDGAVWLKAEDEGDSKDRVLVKSNGLWAYRLSDIAYHESKFARGFELAINLLGPDHHGHIATMQAAMAALGHDVSAVRFIIVQHCTIIRGGRKIKMSTRAGELITLSEVIDEVGVDVARFFFLTRKTDSHLDFDLELAKKQSLDNPVYYVQYAHARIASIMRKAQEQGLLDPGGITRGVYTRNGAVDLGVLSERDIALAAKLGQFGAVLEKAGLEFEPHRLTNYLQELAAEFHNFYNECPVISDDEKLTSARLQLVSAVRVVLQNALHLLGVHIPEVM